MAIPPAGRQGRLCGRWAAPRQKLVHPEKKKGGRMSRSPSLIEPAGSD